MRFRIREGQQDRARIAALRKQIAEIEGRLNAIAARLDKEFPGLCRARKS